MIASRLRRLRDERLNVTQFLSIEDACCNGPQKPRIQRRTVHKMGQPHTPRQSEGGHSLKEDGKVVWHERVARL
jgi:hypothetical protein